MFSNKQCVCTMKECYTYKQTGEKWDGYDLQFIFCLCQGIFRECNICSSVFNIFIIHASTVSTHIYTQIKTKNKTIHTHIYIHKTHLSKPRFIRRSKIISQEFLLIFLSSYCSSHFVSHHYYILVIIYSVV